jgi:hypothetical protein
MTRLEIGQVPEDAHARLIHLSNAFGRLLFETAGLKRERKRDRYLTRSRHNSKSSWTPSCTRSFRSSMASRWRSGTTESTLSSFCWLDFASGKIRPSGR